MQQKVACQEGVEKEREQWEHIRFDGSFFPNHAAAEDRRTGKSARTGLGGRLGEGRDAIMRRQGRTQGNDRGGNPRTAKKQNLGK